MRVLALTLLALVAVAATAAHAAPRSESADFQSFMAFMSKFNKTYPTLTEFQTRFRNFQASLDRVDTRNAARKDGSAVFGVTKFSDLTPAEFKAQMLGSAPPRLGQAADVRHPTSQILPTKVDWRTKGAVTPVKDQGQCGSCWAFSATEEIESQAFLKNGKLFKLAPQQIVSCDTVDSGCEGGWPYLAYQYVEQAGGMTQESAYPYTSGTDGNTGTCELGSDKLVVAVTNFTYATPPCQDTCANQNENLLMANLVQYGPVSICVDAEPWQDYSTGVLMAADCASDYGDLDHCVQLVGFDRTNPTPYHIVRNSWNTDWGMEGYIQLELGANTCGMADAATIADAHVL